MQIVLMGYMGSGKTTIGKYLAEKVKIDYLDLDHYIELKESKSIKSIFSDKGEIYFRQIENKYLKELLNTKNDFVLSLGGGTPCYANNIEIIKEKKYSIYLKGNINTLYNRLINSKTSRPLLENIEKDNLKEFIAKHLFERSNYYEQANIIITIDEKNIDEIIDEISLKIQ